MAVTVHIAVFWIVTTQFCTCNPCYGRTCCLHLQSESE